MTTTSKAKQVRRVPTAAAPAKASKKRLTDAEVAKRLQPAISMAWNQSQMPRELRNPPALPGKEDGNFLLSVAPLNDSASAQVFVQQSKNQAYVKVAYVERLPWEGIQTVTNRWYKFSLAGIK